MHTHSHTHVLTLCPARLWRGIVREYNRHEMCLQLAAAVLLSAFNLHGGALMARDDNTHTHTHTHNATTRQRAFTCVCLPACVRACLHARALYVRYTNNGTAVERAARGTRRGGWCDCVTPPIGGGGDGGHASAKHDNDDDGVLECCVSRTPPTSLGCVGERVCVFVWVCELWLSGGDAALVPVTRLN